MYLSKAQHAVALAAAILLLVSPVNATDYYVDGLHGDDANNGLAIATAKQTIQAAVDLATASGDVVNVLPGEYSTGFVMDADQNGVTVEALGEVVIVSGAAPVATLAANDARIEGFTFRSSVHATFALGTFSTSGSVVERCRFLEAHSGISLGPGLDLTIRECLFVANRNSGIYLQSSSSGNALVERCTFARNEAAFKYGTGPGVSLVVRNCALFWNTHSIGTYIFTHYCNFFGEAAPSPLGTNNTDDPLFIDPDNRVYYVRADSPLLDQGQDGGPIGAFGQGFATSKDVTKDEGTSNPEQGPTPWAAWRWVDGSGNLLPLTDVNSPVEFDTENEILLREGVTSAALYSPVFDTGSEFTVIRSVDFTAFEDTTLSAGSREIIDAVQNTPEREIKIRTHTAAEGTFSQDPGVTPPVFEPAHKQVKFRKRARYVQMELVLRRDGD